MAHFDRADRGIYEPREDIRVFDGSEEEEDVEGARLPLVIVLALLVLAMFAGVVWLAYTQGVARGRTETPVLTAQNGPARVAPQNPGGSEQPYKGFKIYEQPAPPDDAVDSTTPAAPPVVRQEVPPAPAKQVAVAPPPAKPAAPPAPALKPVLAMVSPPPAAKPIVTLPPAAKPVTATPKIAASIPAPAAAKPASPVVTAKNLPPATANAAPRALSPAPAPAASAKPLATQASAGAFVLQVGAYKSQAEADAAWKAYKAKHTTLLAGASEDVQQVDLGDKGTWYRMRLTGFPSKDVADAMCDRLKADGGNCFLGK